MMFDASIDEVEKRMLATVQHDTSDLASQMVHEQLASGGKRLRARLALIACAALQVPQKHGLHWAAAVELLHNATLIHDDIQDGDRIRRGQPTLWATHGSPQAINAGDLMLMLPYLALEGLPAEARAELSLAIAKAATTTVRGQINELNLLPTHTIDRRSYLHTVEAKTGALMGLPVVGACLLAGQPWPQAEQNAQAFVRLGVLFQLQDDVLDLYGNKGRQAIGCDLYEGKVSALVVQYLARHPDDSEWLLKLLRTPRAMTQRSDVEHASQRFRDSGALADVLAEIHHLAASIQEDPQLLAMPALHKVALQLLQRTLQPIEHLLFSSNEKDAVA